MSTLKSKRRQTNKLNARKVLRRLQRKQWRIVQGDCRRVLRRWQRQQLRQFDAVICDPPYNLASIVKRFGKTKLIDNTKTSQRGRNRSDGYARLSRGFMNKLWDNQVAFDPKTWHRIYNMMKPGAYLVAMGGTRTWHRMAVAIEDAGFNIRDTFMYLYGQGFPKSHNISKALDKHLKRKRRVIGKSNRHNSKPFGTGENNAIYRRYKGGVPNIIAPNSKIAKRWHGYGTAVKPAFEPIIIAQKPISEKSIATNVIKYGAGGINIDDCRIPYISAQDLKHQADIARGQANAKKGRMFGGKGRSASNPATLVALVNAADARNFRTLKRGQRSKNDGYGMNRNGGAAVPLLNKLGRWPANIIHDGSPEVLQVFASYGNKTSPRANGNPNNPKHGSKQRIKSSFDWQPERPSHDYRDAGTAARFFYTAKAAKKERVYYCSECQRAFKHHNIPRHQHGKLTAKGKPDFSHITSHPTVKPLALMKYLVTMFTPPNGRVLDPFAGSGTTLQAAYELGFRVTGIEQEAEYIQHIKRRMRELVT